MFRAHGTTNARWRLIDPSGNFVFNNAFFGDINQDIDTLAMPLTGPTLLLEGPVNDTGTASYTVNVKPVIDTTTSLVLGAVTNGSITSSGQVNNFTFTLANPATLYFDSLTNDSSLRWSLTGPPRPGCECPQFQQFRLGRHQRSAASIAGWKLYAHRGCFGRGSPIVLVPPVRSGDRDTHHARYAIQRHAQSR